MSENIRYKAFISYRHTDLDKKVAEKLQRKLESYKPPKGIRQDTGWKIFRDETELSTHSNLSEGILQALGKSEYLILICSESTKHSKWCMQEITYFKKLHNGSTDNIITLVTSGNPEQVFPDEILTTKVYDAETGEMKDKSVEPLAANISSNTEKAALKALDTEFLRIAAPLLRCSYDDLFLRDRRRRRRRITASVAAALSIAVMFSIYSVLTMMKISSQNADLEKKNQLLDSSNSSLRLAYNNLDNANLELERTNANLDLSNLTLKEKNDELDNANNELSKTNKALDDANTELTNTNKKLDDANTELTDANKKLDDANTELTDANKKLDDSNTQLSKANKELDDANTQLTKTNKDLDNANTEISKANEELDKSNKELDQKNKDLDSAYTQIQNTNKDLEKKTQEALDNYEEAVRQKERAEELQAEAEAAYKEAEKQRQRAEELREEAENNYEEAEKQRQIAQENLEKYQQKNAELRISNAEVVAAKGDADLSSKYDRISAIKEVLNARPYEDDETKLLPSATRFLHKALYSFTTILEPRLDITLDAESYIKNFSFSPDRRHIVAYDVLNYVYVFDVDTGDITYKELLNSSVFGAAFSDERHFTVAEYNCIKSIDITDGSTTWEHTKDSLGEVIDGIEFSVDGARAVIWCDKTVYSVDTQSGEILSSCALPKGCTIFTMNDFSDGVHFATVMRYGQYYCLATVDTEASKLNVFSYMTSQNTILCIKYVPGVGYGVLYKENGYDGATVYKQFNAAGKALFTQPIYISTVSDSEIKKPFTVEDTGETFVPIAGIDALDERPVVYFICVDTQQVKSLHMPAPVRQVGYRGTDGTIDGWVSVYTSKGTQYHYNLYNDESYIGHMTIDTQMSNADGSTKLIWVEGNTVAALGEATSKIMIYRSMYDTSYISARHDDAYIMRTTTVTKDYVIGENDDTFYVYDKYDKSLIKTIPADHFVTDYGVYNGQIVSSDKENGKIWFYSVSSDDAYYIDMHQFSSPDRDFWKIAVNSGEDTLAAISQSDIVIFRGDTVLYKEYDRFFDVGYNSPIAFSPDGNKLMLQSFSSNDGVWYHLDVIDTNDLSVHNLITQDKIIYNNTLYFQLTGFVISDDSRLAAVVYEKSIRIYDIESCQLVSEISLGARSAYSLLFEPDSDKLLVVTGDLVLMEFDVHSGDQLNSLVLPNRASPEDYGLRRMLDFNIKGNELILSNENYVCFINLDYFDVSAETTDDYTIYRGFIDDTQELIIQGSRELLFYPYYSSAELIEKAEQLVCG